MLEMPMQIRLNKDQRRRAVMVKGQKRLCGPALTSTVPPVDGNNGCQHLTPKKTSVSKLFLPSRWLI